MHPFHFFRILNDLFKPVAKRKPKKTPSNFKARKRSSKPPLKVAAKHKRGTNAKTFQFTPGKHDPDKITKTLGSKSVSNKLDYLRRRNKPDGHHYKPPQGIVVVITVKKGRNKYHYTKVTDYDFVVSKQSTEKFIQDSVNSLQEEYDTQIEAMEDAENEPGEPDDVDANPYIENLDPEFIHEVTVKFIYGKTGAAALETFTP